MKIIFNSEQKKIIDFVFERLNCEAYIVGGFVRDYLLDRKSDDLDFACPLLPDEIHTLFPDSLFYQRFGTASFNMGNTHITIASFRKESDYKDFRHPQNVVFVKSFYEDFYRRDFTINALYSDKFGNIFDPSKSGLEDLKNKLIRFILTPDIRVKEDPLRMIRAMRFSLDLGFEIEKNTYESIMKNINLLRLLNKNKIMEELHKTDEINRNRIIEILHIK